jgi:Fe2+ transport system protein FeoA
MTNRAKYLWKSYLQLSLNYPSLPTVKDQEMPSIRVLEGQCARSEVCPLSQIEAGSTVCIKQLITHPEMSDRLRELGVFEKQKIKLLARNSSFICQVCNARLGISEKLAESILVENVMV